MAPPLTNLNNPNTITAASAVVDNVSWTVDWSTVVNYINDSLTASFNVFANTGDIMCYTGTAITTLTTTGIADGWVLTKSAAATQGLAWAAPPGLPFTTAGDLLYYNGSSTVRLPIGTPGQALTVNGAGTLPVWQAQGGLPANIIVLWSGAINAVPAGWGICDGVHNAVGLGGSGINLQGLFVVGAGATSPAATGGMGLIAPQTLAGDTSSGAGVGKSYSVNVTSTTVKAGTGAVNTVGVSGATSSVVVTPRYYALCYIELL